MPIAEPEFINEVRLYQSHRLRAGGTVRSKGIEQSSPAYACTRSYALPSRTIAFNTTNN